MPNLVRAIQNERGVENDLTTLCKWVREELFFVLIHDLKSENDETMSAEGPLCKSFVRCYLKRENRSSIVNADIHGAADEEMEAYLKHLWRKGISNETKGKGNIRKNLSLEKTAVYAAINDTFKTLMIDCMIHKVPFPAYETFEDRRRLPRRFFLFFDKFFKAGRHNKELWNVAIERNQGRNDISFGPCIFEAHLRTTIQENYFTWMYQALTSPSVIPSLRTADDFKTEYDFDILPEKLACNCPLILQLPVSWECKYNTSTKVFETSFGEAQEEDEDDDEADLERECLQKLVDANKEERRATLKVLREMVDRDRPEYPKYSREQKKDFNMQAKRTFRMFLDSDKENDRLGGATTTTTPSSNNKRQKRPSPQNKCRVSKEKLDAFKAVTDRIMREKASGLRSAWERLYKTTMYKNILVDEEQDAETLKPADFLLELEELDNTNWKTQSSSIQQGQQDLDGESEQDDPPAHLRESV